MERELLFRVHSDGREYLIYSNGQVEGFGENPEIVNYFPLLQKSLLAQWAAGAIKSDHLRSSATNTDNVEPTGVSHVTPL